MNKAPDRIFARLDRSTVRMNGASPLVAYTREFRDATEYVRADAVAGLERACRRLLTSIEAHADTGEVHPIRTIETDEAFSALATLTRNEGEVG